MTLENALTLAEFRDGLRDDLLRDLEIRVPLALTVAKRLGA